MTGKTGCQMITDSSRYAVLELGHRLRMGQLVIYYVHSVVWVNWPADP